VNYAASWLVAQKIALPGPSHARPGILWDVLDSAVERLQLFGQSAAPKPLITVQFATLLIANYLYSS
jgi:hypothetical protein